MGRKHSEETKRKISESLLKMYRRHATKAQLIHYDDDDEDDEDEMDMISEKGYAIVLKNFFK